MDVKNCYRRLLRRASRFFLLGAAALRDFVHRIILRTNAGSATGVSQRVHEYGGTLFLGEIWRRRALYTLYDCSLRLAISLRLHGGSPVGAPDRLVGLLWYWDLTMFGTITNLMTLNAAW